MRETKIIKAVCEHFGVTLEEVSGKSRKAHICMSRNLIVHLLTGRTPENIAKIINRAPCQVYKIRAEMNIGSERDPLLKDHVKAINQLIQEMNIKINRSQLGSLWEVLEMFLSMKPESVTLELVCLLLEEIKEKSRKRYLNHKENISLDEKQVAAFQIWHYHFGGSFEELHPHGHITLIDIINQIKPIAHAHTITIQA